MSRRAFTLIEMLVVISLITLLISLLLPSLGKSKENARDVICRSQMSQIGRAVLALVNDNHHCLPGLWGPPWTGSDPIQGSFMGKEVFTGSYQPTPAAKVGTLVEYLGSEGAAREVYRCPSLAPGVFGSGAGSNGMFDVTMMQCLPGARMLRIPPTATYIDPGSNQPVSTPFPVIIEEDPAFGINKNFIDFGHTSINRFSTTHFGRGGNYVAIDGSGHGLRFTQTPGPEGWSWSARITGGAGEINMGIAKPYGGWGS